MDLLFPAEGRYEPDYGHNLFRYDNTAFPMSNSSALMKSVADFECDARDVTIVGFPKSGTNWVQAMVQKLYDDDWGTLKASAVVPHLDIGSHSGVSGYEYCTVASHPRLMKSHSLLRHMPRAFLQDHIGKVIYVSRNPKDVCDSYYNQLDSLRTQQQFTLDWPTWVEHFISGNVCFGPWLDHVVEWMRLGKEQHVLHLRYEEMKSDVRSTLQCLIEFVGRPVSADKIDVVIEQTSFSTMQQGEGAKLYNGPVARREGKAGGWRKHFTVAQNDLFEREIVGQLDAHSIHFNYG